MNFNNRSIHSTIAGKTMFNYLLALKKRGPWHEHLIPNIQPEYQPIRLRLLDLYRPRFEIRVYDSKVIGHYKKVALIDVDRVDEDGVHFLTAEEDVGYGLRFSTNGHDAHIGADGKYTGPRSDIVDAIRAAALDWERNG